MIRFGGLIAASLLFTSGVNMCTPPTSYILKNNPEALWVDSVYQTMTLRERIGQLFIIRAHSNLDEKHNAEVERLVRDFKVGGLCFFQGGPYRQAILTNRYQKAAKIPLLVSIDGEWGLGMRLDSTMNFPRQMALGAIQDDSLIYQMGAEIAFQFRRVGIHLNFAPVVDVNNNANNPVIGDRSFGEDRENVARKGVAYMKGMQDNGLIANAKHFPGHGDTDKDSHYTLPVISHQTDRLKAIEMYPFAALARNGLLSVMVAHLKIPALDKDLQTTLSANVIQGWLQDSLKFQGLVFTDALEMKGVADFFAPGDLELKAYRAGNDMLVLSGNVPKAIETLENAVKQKKIKEKDLEKRVKKILTAKYFAGLHQYKPVELKGLAQDLHRPQAYLIHSQLYQNALTIVKNEQKIIPLQKSDSLASVSIGLNLIEKNAFQKMLDNYAAMEHFQANYAGTDFNALFDKVKNKKNVIVALHNIGRRSADQYGLSNFALSFLKNLSQKTKVITVAFGSPYSLRFLADLPNVLCAYEDNWTAQRLTAQMLFGAFAAKGKLPVSADAILKRETGTDSPDLQRLRFGFPEEVGLNRDSLLAMDRMIEEAIADTLMPGCQVVVVRRGVVAWQKAYGHQKYDKQTPITPQTIYDVASLTKVLSTTQAIMYLYEKGAIDLNEKLGTYLPELKNTNKANLLIRDVLTHQAGLIPYIPFYERTLLADKSLNPLYYQRTKRAKYSLEVAQGIYGLASLPDSLWKWSIESKLREKPANQAEYKYEYSDVGLYLMRRLAEVKLIQPIDRFVTNTFYKPLGLSFTGYQPLNHFKPEQIAPTETDTYFRQQTVQGYVHDQGAAMHGGVAGHAGLFSTAYEVAVLMQLQLQKGYYGGARYFRPETIDLFTKRQFAQNRRGLGWDKASESEKIGYIADSASVESFGHSGFTGCVAWAEPKSGLIVVFLSNRIYPSAENKKMIAAHFRRKLLNTVYGAIRAQSPK